MDQHSAMIAEKVSDSILASALAEERKLDAQLKKMDTLGKLILMLLEFLYLLYLYHAYNLYGVI